jgi:DNA/RNA-binding domain of Phe-tRNA-synthetase-like protein
LPPARRCSTIPRVLTINPHPHVEIGAFTADLPRPLGELASPAWLVALLGRDAAPAVAEATTAAVRDALRGHGYKPTGRGKPASEYLRRAAAEGTLASINLLVDACNATSLASGLPVSVVDVDKLTPPLYVDVAAAGASYPFNASGQVIDVAGLPCLHDAAGPCANAVKDAQRTKTSPATRRALCIVWGAKALGGATARAVGTYREILERAGAATSDL